LTDLLGERDSGKAKEIQHRARHRETRPPAFRLLSAEILKALQAVLELDPKHPLANHLYIHACEASPHPEKADAAADRLRDLQPALGHMVHMPSHIDIRRGRWQAAIEANDRAITADRNYAKTVPEQGFYRMYMAHNHHMMAFAAMMQGESKRALTAVRDMLADVPKDWVALPENAAIADGFVAAPLEVMKRFGQWDELPATRSASFSAMSPISARFVTATRCTPASRARSWTPAPGSRCRRC
jgi:tetratricopeptide (TPR) repeat protein